MRGTGLAHAGSARAHGWQSTCPPLAGRARAPRATLQVVASLRPRCPYGTLGVQANASETEIKQAYRKLVLQHHPDVNRQQGAEMQFMSIQQAYELLTNKSRGGPGGGAGSHSGTDDSWKEWFWGFLQKRRWRGYKRGAAAAGAGGGEASGPAAAGAAHAAGAAGAGPSSHSQPQDPATIRSQLAGLRHRAAIRARKQAPRYAAAAAGAAAGQQQQQEQQHHHQEQEEQQQHAGLEVDSSEMGDGCNLASGVTGDWRAAAEAHAAAAAARQRFSASEGHKQQVMSQVAGLHRMAAAAAGHQPAGSTH